MSESKLNYFEETYVDLVKHQLHLLGEDELLEDIDLLCQYIVLRFLRTSSMAHSMAHVLDVEAALLQFTKDIFPFLTTFVTMVNSLPLWEKKRGDA